MCRREQADVKKMKKKQFVLCELLFLWYTGTDVNHGGICVIMRLYELVFIYLL